MRLIFIFFFFTQKTAYEMRISDWSSDVCSSDLRGFGHRATLCPPFGQQLVKRPGIDHRARKDVRADFGTFFEHHHLKRIIDLLEPDRRREARRPAAHDHNVAGHRFTFNSLGAHEAGPFDYFTCQTVRQALIAGRSSEEHTSELQSLMSISYAVLCLKKKKNTIEIDIQQIYKKQRLNDYRS